MVVFFTVKENGIGDIFSLFSENLNNFFPHTTNVNHPHEAEKYMIKGEKDEKSKEEKTGIVNGGFYAFYERFR